jgi:hypothetical protein
MYSESLIFTNSWSNTASATKSGATFPTRGSENSREAEATSLRPEELLCETPAARPLFIKTRFRLEAIRAWKLCPRPEKEQGTERATEGEEAEGEKERAPHPRSAAAEEDDILVATAATDAIVVATNNKATHTSKTPKKTHLLLSV